MTSTIINGSYDESRWDDAVDAFRKMPMLFPRRGLSFANLCSTHMSLSPPLCFSLSFTNPSLDIFNSSFSSNCSIQSSTTTLNTFDHYKQLNHARSYSP